jgi:NAD(P)-dependent dehydrogenase (short-subunit alcohol dehydrogenase family)
LEPKKIRYDYKKKQNYGNSIQKKVAIITGGSSGIGRATALAFKKRSKIVIVDWHESPELCRVLQT